MNELECLKVLGWSAGLAALAGSLIRHPLRTGIAAVLVAFAWRVLS
jgi:hypothetical protein